MIGTEPPQTRQREAAEEPLALELGPYYYADSYEITLSAPDDHTMEEWARCSIEEAPLAVRETIANAWRHVLRFQLGPTPSPDNVLGFPIVSSEPNLIHLEARSPLMRGVIVGRRIEPTRIQLTTLLFYERPGPARLVWVTVGPLHRRLVPSLLTAAAERFAR